MFPLSPPVKGRILNSCVLVSVVVCGRGMWKTKNFRNRKIAITNAQNQIAVDSGRVKYSAETRHANTHEQVTIRTATTLTKTHTTAVG